MSLLKFNTDIVNNVNIPELNGDTLPAVFDGKTKVHNDYKAVEIEGLSLEAEQLVTNGDFSDGTTAWLSSETSLSISDGILTAIYNAEGDYFYQPKTLISGQKYILVFRAKTNTSNTFSLRLRSSTAHLIGDQALTSSYNTYSVSFTADSTSSELRFIKLSGDETTVLFDYIYLFKTTDLINTKQYSPLYEDTFDNLSDAQIKAQMDSWIADGTLPNDNQQSVSMNKRIKSVGKNLVNINDIYEDKTSTDYYVNQNVVIITNTTKYSRIALKPKGLKANTQYTLSFNSDKISGVSNLVIAIEKLNGEKVITDFYPSNGVKTTKIFTTDDETDILLLFYTSTSDEAIGSVVEYSNIQLEQGTVATDYEPYVSSELYIQANKVGNSVGDTKDTIEYRNGKYFFNQRVGVVTDLDTPIYELNNHTLREVFETNNLFNSVTPNAIRLTNFVNENPYVLIPDSSLGEHYLDFNLATAGLNSNDNYYTNAELLTADGSYTFRFMSYSFNGIKYNDIVFSDDNVLKQYSYDGNVPNDYVAGFNFLIRYRVYNNASNFAGNDVDGITVKQGVFVNKTDLGITLNKEQMDYFYKAYQNVSEGKIGYYPLETRIETEIETSGSLLVNPIVNIQIDDLDEFGEVSNGLTSRSTFFGLNTETTERIVNVDHTDIEPYVDGDGVYRDYINGRVFQLQKYYLEGILDSVSIDDFNAKIYEPYTDYFIVLADYDQSRSEMKNWYRIYTESLDGSVSIKEPSSYDATTTTIVDGGRNTEGYFIGDVIRDDLAKVEASWKVLTATEWSLILKIFDIKSGGSFVVSVTFFSQTDNAYVTRDMYISDRKANVYVKQSNGRVVWLNPSFSLVEV